MALKTLENAKLMVIGMQVTRRACIGLEPASCLVGTDLRSQQFRRRTSASATSPADWKLQLLQIPPLKLDWTKRSLSPYYRSPARKRSQPLPPFPSRSWSLKEPATSNNSDADNNDEEIEDLKGQLMQAVSLANNPPPGSNPVEAETAVEALAERLAVFNPTPNPAISPMISGTWALLYTGKSRRIAPERFNNARKQGGLTAKPSPLQRASDAAYAFFYKRFPIIAGSAVGGKTTGANKVKNVQIIDLEAKRVDNIVEFNVNGSGKQRGSVCVGGSADTVPMQNNGRTKTNDHLKVCFDGFEIVLGENVRIALPLRWLSPVGYVDTVYLDEQLRISVGDKGSLFVVSRLK